MIDERSRERCRRFFQAKRSSTELVRNLVSLARLFERKTPFFAVVASNPSSLSSPQQPPCEILSRSTLGFLRQRLFRFPADKVNDSKTGKAWRKEREERFNAVLVSQVYSKFHPIDKFWQAIIPFLSLKRIFKCTIFFRSSVRFVIVFRNQLDFSLIRLKI